MMAAEFLTIDYVFQGAVGIVMTVLWRYIGKVDGKFDAVQTDNLALRERLHEVEKAYRRQYQGIARNQPAGGGDGNRTRLRRFCTRKTPSSGDGLYRAD